LWHCHEQLWLSSLTKSRKMDEDRGPGGWGISLNRQRM
jgi:hypothetical protein